MNSRRHNVSLTPILWVSVLATLLSAPARPAGAQSAARTGSVRGVVFDSLLMKTMPRASVTIVPGSRTVSTNDRGEFEFDRVAAGTYAVTLAPTVLDSLGLGTVGALVTVIDGRAATATITTPSLRSLWMVRCAQSSHISRSTADSGIVWGTIGDARSDTLLDGASATFQWYDLTPRQTRAFDIAEERRTVRSNASGMYFACGVPSDQNIKTVAVIPNAASSVVEYSLGPHRVRRLDLLVSSDMISADTVLRNSITADLPDPARGSAILQGVVTDSAKRPLEGAIVRIMSAEVTARTDVNGAFRLESLPGGTQTLEVRRIGSTPVTQIVQLRPDRRNEVAVQMINANTLASFAVRGMSVKRAEFEERRAAHIGYAVDSSILNNRTDLVSALRNVPFVHVTRNGSGITVTARYDFAYFLDGLPVSLSMVSVLPPDHFRAIEIIRLPEQVPPQYYSNGLGVVLFWSVNTKW